MVKCCIQNASQNINLVRDLIIWLGHTIYWQVALIFTDKYRRDPRTIDKDQTVVFPDRTTKKTDKATLGIPFTDK